MLRIDLSEQERQWHITGEGQDLLADSVVITTDCKLVLNPRRFGGWLEVDGELQTDGNTVSISSNLKPRTYGEPSGS